MGGLNKTLMKGPGPVAGLRMAARNECWLLLPLNRPGSPGGARRVVRRRCRILIKVFSPPPSARLGR